MNENTQLLEEDYVVKVSFTTILKDFFGTTKGSKEEAEIENRIEELNKSTDMSYIASLEKGMQPIKTSKVKSKDMGANVQERGKSNIEVKSINDTKMTEIEEQELEER